MSKAVAVIPFLVYEDSIDKCINSLLNNRRLSMIYLVQNGVNDLTKVRETKRTIQKIYIRKNVTYLHVEKKGASAALNFVIDLTDAEYLLFASSHSYFEEGYIDTLLEEAEKDTLIGAIGGRTVCLPHDSSFQSVAVRDAFASFLASFNRYRNYRKHEKRIYNDRIYGALYRIDALKDAGKFDEKRYRGQDYDVIYRINKRGFKTIVYPAIDVFLVIKEKNFIGLFKRYYKQAFWSRRNKEKRVPLLLSILFVALLFSVLFFKIALLAMFGVICFLLLYSFLVSSRRKHSFYLFLCLISIYVGYFIGLFSLEIAKNTSNAKPIKESN